MASFLCVLWPLPLVELHLGDYWLHPRPHLFPRSAEAALEIRARPSPLGGLLRLPLLQPMRHCPRGARGGLHAGGCKLTAQQARLEPNPLQPLPPGCPERDWRLARFEACCSKRRECLGARGVAAGGLEKALRSEALKNARRRRSLRFRSFESAPAKITPTRPRRVERPVRASPRPKRSARWGLTALAASLL